MRWSKQVGSVESCPLERGSQHGVEICGKGCSCWCKDFSLRTIDKIRHIDIDIQSKSYFVTHFANPDLF